MPAKNSIKQYTAESFYHLYNRGVEKREIFRDEQDYSVFLSYIKTYLLPKDENSLNKIIASQKIPSNEKYKVINLFSLNNFSEEIDLLAYALLPNHFHLLVKQKNPDGIDKLMNSLGTRYVMYFNKKYQRVGPLFQGAYKAVLVETDEQLLQLSYYIHLNPTKFLGIPFSRWPEIKWPFSLSEYLGQRKTRWLKTNFILDYFDKKQPNESYAKFMNVELPTDQIESIALDLND